MGNPNDSLLDFLKSFCTFIFYYIFFFLLKCGNFLKNPRRMTNNIWIVPDQKFGLVRKRVLVGITPFSCHSSWFQESWMLLYVCYFSHTLGYISPVQCKIPQYSVTRSDLTFCENNSKRHFSSVFSRWCENGLPVLPQLFADILSPASHPALSVCILCRTRMIVLLWEKSSWI